MNLNNKFLVIYTDKGPTGMCGQSMSTTCPHTHIHIFDSEQQFKDSDVEIGRRGSKQEIRMFDIDNYGQTDLRNGNLLIKDHSNET